MADIPADIVQRAIALGEDPGFYGYLLERDTADVVRGFLSKLEEATALSAEWSPRLFAYSEACRRDNPAPSPESLGTKDLAKISVFEHLVSKSCPRERQRKYMVTIAIIPLIAVSVAQRLWPGTNEKTVILTPDECQGWLEHYRHPPGAFSWIHHHRWMIEDEPQAGSEPFYEFLEFTPSEASWLASSCDGDWYKYEAWNWDGARASFGHTLCEMHCK